MVHVRPGELRDVNQPVHAAQVDKGAKVTEAADDALADLAHHDLFEELCALLGADLTASRPF